MLRSIHRVRRRPAIALGLLFVGLAIAVAAVWNVRNRHRTYEGKTVLEWALDLESPNAQVRSRAEERLRAIGSEAVPDLMGMLESKEPLWHRPLVSLASRLPTRAGAFVLRTIQPWRIAQERMAAVHALKVLGPHAAPAAASLGQALRSSSIALSWQAGAALGCIGPPAVPHLTGALQDPNPAVRSAALDGLMKAGPQASNALPALVALLSDRQTNFAAQAARAIVNMGTASVPALAQTLQSPEPRLRHRAATILGAIGIPARAAVPDLLPLLDDPDPVLRQTAIDALGRIRPSAPEVVQALERKLRDPDDRVRLEALRALARSPKTAKIVLPALQEMLEDASPPVRERASKLLEEIGL